MTENQSTQRSRVPPSNGRPATPERSPSASEPLMLPAAATALPALSRALAYLCAAKNQAQFTRMQLECWAATLSIFPGDVVNRAIVELALSQDAFPDLGKIVCRCQIEQAKRSTVVSQADTSKPLNSTIAKVAQAMQIDIGKAST